MNMYFMVPDLIFSLETITGDAANLFLVVIIAVLLPDGICIRRPSIIFFFIPNFSVTNFVGITTYHNIV